MSAYTKLCADLLFPLHERLKGHDTVGRRRELEESQWWSPERVCALQLVRLRAFMTEIGQRVPYFRDLFKATGFDPSSVMRITDLRQLPLHGKAEMRANVKRLKADGATGLSRYNTGGSSGEPLVFYIGRNRRSHDVAAKWRATRWWGVDIGDPEIVVWGSPIEISAQDRLRDLRDALMRSRLLPAFDMSEHSLDRYVETIRKRRPRMLFGYPSSLALIASHARKRGISVSDLGIKVAFVTSERLYEDQREKIGSAFGCRVANGYGGRDAGFIAHECPSGGMHVSAEDIVIEIIDGSGNPAPLGTAGEIVVTHLATGDFPFVRYRTGDVGALAAERCPCGRGLPLIKEIQGRTTDLVVASDGTLMHALALIYEIRALPGIERFKIVQHDRTRTDVMLVPGPGYEETLHAVIRDAFRRRLGNAVQVNVKTMDSIPADANGKYRYVVSNALRQVTENPVRDTTLA